MFYNYNNKIMNFDKIACIEKDKEDDCRVIFWTVEAGTFEEIIYEDNSTRNNEFNKIVAYMDYKKLLVGNDDI